MAKKTAAIDDFIHLASKLPWWLCLLLAASSGLLLHALAGMSISTSVDIRHMDSMLFQTVLKGIATVGQFVMPLIFVGGAIVSIASRRKRNDLLGKAGSANGQGLADITWLEFELVVGETLRRQGFSIQEKGGSGPDAGVDLVARKDGEKYLVQCKHWRSLQVGVPVVRELYGAMAAEGAVSGFVVISGTFTKPAREFASGRNLQLIDGASLARWIAAVEQRTPKPRTKITPEPFAPVLTPEVVSNPQPPKETQAPVKPQAPACPHCRKPMVTKIARTGRNAGGNFWGCMDYPKCRGIRAIPNVRPSNSL